MPIKRNEFLQPFSREHHHGLLLCWKIRAGIKKKVETDRIKKYADWFYQNHLLPHFELEEKYVFTVLDAENQLVANAILEHERLKSLFEATTEIEKNLHLIEEELQDHIRFEERVLFNEIQKCATAAQLQTMQLYHTDEKFVDNVTDPFWE